MELEDRVEALEYLVCLLLQESSISKGPISGVNQSISEGIFTSKVDNEQREKIVAAIKEIQKKVRARPSRVPI